MPAPPTSTSERRSSPAWPKRSLRSRMGSGRCCRMDGWRPPGVCGRAVRRHDGVPLSAADFAFALDVNANREIGIGESAGADHHRAR